MEVKPGYKQTEVGVIPEEWEVPYLRQHLLQDATYGVVKAGAFQRTGIPMLRSGEIKNGAIIEDHPLITPQKSQEYSRTVLKKNDVVIALVGYPGETAVIPEGLVGANISRAVGLLRPAANLRPEFLACFLNSPIGRKEFLRPSAGSAQIVVNLGALNKLRLPVPSLSEQCAIAEALSDVDRLLGGLDRLIAKKHDLKQAAMQQLLTGQTRLPGFHGEWAETTLGQIGDCIIGLTYKPENVVEHGLLVLRSSNVQNGSLAYDDNVHVNLQVAEHLYTQFGDILVCVRNGSRALIGKCAVIDSAVVGVTFGAFMSIYRTKHWRFIFHAFQADNIQRQIRDNIGATINQITNKDMKVFRLRLPPEDEQTAIAEVLTEMDAELAALQQRREKTRALKQAMMQELLTGRIRLIGGEPAAIDATPSSPTATVAAPTPAHAVQGHNWQINEAVIIGVLAAKFGTEEWPLPRKRRVKLMYLLHRHHERLAHGYLKKAAGPYNPAIKYQGPEKIAIKNGYVREHHNGKYPGFIAGNKVAQANEYFAKWYGDRALQWLEQFHYEKTEELELLATVDMAIVDLGSMGLPTSVDATKTVIRSHPEWEAKLDRPIFSDANIAQAIDRCQTLFADERSKHA